LTVIFTPLKSDFETRFGQGEVNYHNYCKYCASPSIGAASMNTKKGNGRNGLPE